MNLSCLQHGSILRIQKLVFNSFRVKCSFFDMNGKFPRNKGHFVIPYRNNWKLVGKNIHIYIQCRKIPQ